MAGLVWMLRCALLCVKFFSDSKDATSRRKTFRDFQEKHSCKEFSYKYSVHPLSSKTKTNLQVQFDSEWQTKDHFLDVLPQSLIIYIYLSRIYLFIYMLLFFYFQVKR